MVKGQLLPGGVHDRELIESFSALPRELFVLEKTKDVAYLDKNIPLGQGRCLISPCTYALLLQKAAIKPDDVVLDIGSASGYSSAILSPLVTTVIALECNKRQIDKANRLWDKMELCNIAIIEKDDISSGYKKCAPYSLIIINGSVENIPQNILNQLSPNGRLLCFLRKKNSPIGNAMLFHNNRNNVVSSQKLFNAAVPFLEEFSYEDDFNF